MECPACHTPNVDGARFCAKCGALLPTSADEGDPLVGKMVGGRFMITGILGEGGMGRVYTGEQRMGTSIRKVAVKTLLAQYTKDPQVRARFDRECGTVSELEHPNTIKVYDFGQTDGGDYYIAMELLTGVSLEKALEGGPLHPERVDKILGQVCGSLQEAHDKGIVHRDLKPANIYLTVRAGEEDYAKVLDFGIAKKDEKHSTKAEQKLTQQGTVLGTPPYMSPEQFKGGELDARSDIYSLGVMTYEMLTGRLPFDADTPWAWATQHMTAQPFPFETIPLGSQVPPKMKAAVMRALSKDKNQRQQKVRDFFDEFTMGAPRPSGMGPRSSLPMGASGTAMMPGSMGPGQTQIGEPAFSGVPSAPNPTGNTLMDASRQGMAPYQSSPQMQAYSSNPQMQAYPSNPQMQAYPSSPGMPAQTGSGQVFPAPPPPQAKKGGAGPIIAIVSVVAVLGVVGLVFALKGGGGGKEAADAGVATQPTPAVTQPPPPVSAEPTTSVTNKPPPPPPPQVQQKTDPRAEHECQLAKSLADGNQIAAAQSHYRNCKGPGEMPARMAIDQAQKREKERNKPPPCRGRHCPR